jgi:hypothetical protein
MSDPCQNVITLIYNPVLTQKIGIMKKLVLFLPFLFAFLDFSSQSAFSLSFHNRAETATNILEVIGSDYYFISHTLQNTDNRSIWLNRVDKNGNLKFKSAISTIPFYSFKSLDGKLMILGHYDYCDTPPQTRPVLLSKIDTSGVNIFTDTIQGSGAMLQYIDSTFIGFYLNNMYRYDKNGQLISKVNTGLQVYSSLLLPNNNILVSTLQGFTELTVSGTIVSSTPGITLYRMSLYGAQKVVGLKYAGPMTTICKFSTTFKFLDSLHFNTPIIDYSADNDTLYLINNNQGQGSYNVLDTAFISLVSNTTTTQKFSQSSIRKIGSKVAILSNYGVEVSYPFMGMYTYGATINVFDRLGANQFSNDMAVLSFEKDSSYILNNTAYVRAKVKVKNKGNIPLTSFKLNCFLYPHVACGRYYYQQDFTGFNIMSGDSATIKTGFIKKPIFVNTDEVSFCIYSTSPNGETDKQLMDNEVCKSFNIHTLSVSELMNAASIEVYPNPVVEKLSLNSSSVIDQIEVMDYSGKVIKIETIEDNQAEFDCSRWPAGLYLIRIKSNDYTIIKKVVKL